MTADVSEHVREPVTARQGRETRSGDPFTPEALPRPVPSSHAPTRIIQINDHWALAHDRLQWILQRRHRVGRDMWDGVSFVSSSKDILARCMREKGIPDEDARAVLDTLPDTFTEFAEEKAR